MAACMRVREMRLYIIIIATVDGLHDLPSESPLLGSAMKASTLTTVKNIFKHFIFCKHCGTVRELVCITTPLHDVFHIFCFTIYIVLFYHLAYMYST